MRFSKPELIVLVGLPASGKSSYAKHNFSNYKIISSDEIRKQLFGNEEFQGDNKLVFDRLYMIMQSYLLTYNDVVIDATNISYKQRRNIFDRIKNISCYKKAIVLATPYDICLERNKIRERKVPEYAIKNMYCSFDFPQYFEGFDEIEIIHEYTKEECKRKIQGLYVKMKNFDQKNPFHKLTLDKHNRLVYDILKDKQAIKILQIAGLYHDIGKTFTQKWDEEKQRMTYYGHHNVSTYIIMTLRNYFHNVTNNDYEFYEILFYINYHMLPYNFKEEKTIDKYKNLFGEGLFNNLMLLHEADKLAH